MAYSSHCLCCRSRFWQRRPTGSRCKIWKSARGRSCGRPLIDGHNDLPSRLLDPELANGDLARFDFRAVQPKYPADLPRLREGGVGAQFWAAYVDVAYIKRHESLREALREIDVIHQLVERYPELRLVTTADEIEQAHHAGAIGSLIGVEGGHAIENSLASLRLFHRLGVRYMTLTHWDTIDWADAATGPANHQGLTAFGEEVVREMNRLGMFVDLSHVSADTMRDALRVTQAPLIFSHSNARAVADHPRNVPDDVLRPVAANGGVVMVNFIDAYVAPGAPVWSARRVGERDRLRSQVSEAGIVAERLREWERQNPPPRGSVADVATHIDHIRRVTGVDHVGIGSDFYNDGMTDMVPGLENPSRFPALFAELLRRGYTPEDLKKIAGQNLLRAMRQMERVSARLRRERPPSTSTFAEAR